MELGPCAGTFPIQILCRTHRLEQPLRSPRDQRSSRAKVTRPHIRVRVNRLRTGNVPFDATFIATGLGSPHSTRFMSEEGFMPGATTVGLVCKDGAILASERRYSYGTFVMSKAAKKVFKITDNIGVGCAGIIG